MNPELREDDYLQKGNTSGHQYMDNTAALSGYDSYNDGNNNSHHYDYKS